MARDYAVKHYFGLIKKALRRVKELNIEELIERTGVKRSTLEKYIERAEGKGWLEVRWEGKRRWFSLKK